MKPLRLAVVGCALVALLAACGNASNNSNNNSSPTNTEGGPAATTVPTADLQKNVPVKAPGVTNSDIKVAVVADYTNILGTNFTDFSNGIQSYFDWMNGQGGIYGRKLVIGNKRDDKMTANLQEVKNSLNLDNAFATFVGTNLFTGADALAKANMPTFIWNITPAFAGHDNIFANAGSICFGCVGQQLPSIIKANGWKTVAILGYGVAAESKLCAQGDKKSIEKYNPDVKIAVYDDEIGFAEPNLTPQVTEMRKAGVQFVATCIDNKESITLGREMAKQGLHAVQQMPNGYDSKLVAENADVLEGSLVTPQMVPVEWSPLPKLGQTMVEQVQKSGYSMGELTEVGWILADEFVTGLKLAGPQFSQQAVIDGLNTQTAYSAGGLISPIDWTKQHNDPAKVPGVDPTHCATYVKVESGKFVPVYTQPNKPWHCVGPATEPTLSEPTYMNFEPAG